MYFRHYDYVQIQHIESIVLEYACRSIIIVTSPRPRVFYEHKPANSLSLSLVRYHHSARHMICHIVCF